MLKRQNVSSERVCLFATVWKRAVFKFTHRYTKLFILCWKTSLAFLFSGSTFAFCSISHFYCSQTITAHQEQKRKSTTLLFCFSIQCFWKCTLVCSTAVPFGVFVRRTHTQTHTGALEQIKVDVLISYFLYP